MTANGLFSKDGVREVSIDDICRKLCISKKTFYQYYAQKEDLVADVVTYNVERKKDEFERMVEGKNAVQVLKAMFALIGRKKTMDKDKRMVKDIMKYYPETFIKHAEDRSKALHNFFVDCFDTGRKEGLIRSDMDVEGVQLLIYIMHEGMAEYLDGGHRIEGKRVSFKSLSAAFEDIVTRVLLTPKGFEEYSSTDKCKNSYYSMKNRLKYLVLTAAALPLALTAQAQYRNDTIPKESPKDTSLVTLTLNDALQIALSENVAVKVADKEIQRTEYAKKGTYASLFPQINASGAYQRTIKKQVMYMDSDSGSDEEGGGGMGFLSSLGPYFMRINELSAKAGMDPVKIEQTEGGSGSGGFAVGRWNTYNYGVSASMPIVNAQLWESLKISGQSVDLAVEKARSSRLDMVTQVKQAYYSVLLAKEAFNVYRDVYENAVDNFAQTERRYNAQKASELEYTRAKSTVAAAIPDVYNAESSVILALWQLKAVMGVDLDRNIDVSGSLEDFSKEMFRDINENSDPSLEYNTTLRQLEIQAEQLASTVRMQKAAYLPSIAANFSYSMIAMTNDFKFSEYQWSPYSYVGVSISIPIFSGGKRHNDVRQTKVQAAQLDLQRIETERQLKIAIRQYLNTMETNMKSFNSANEAVALARKAYDIAAKSYKVVKSTITELNDAQLTLTQASLAQSQAVYNFVVAKSNLEKTLGYDFIDEKGDIDLENM